MLNVLPMRRDRDDEEPLRLPPSSIEAEEAVLGSILLDPDAISRVESILQPDAFYIKAHAHIYAAAVALKAQDRPVDMIHVAAALKDAERLESIGGKLRLAQLVDRAISSANVDHYARLVADKALRRQLGVAARKIEQISYETLRELPDVLSEAEQTVFSVSQQLRTGKVASVAEIATDAFAEIEARSQGLVPAGIPSRFYDLDAMTQGFQRSDLVIAAGRPSMGKTALMTGIAANIASAQQMPILICSLEMSKKQMLYRLLSPLAQIESGRLRTGRIANHEWESLGRAIDQLGQMPIFIDDSGLVTVSEIASKAREIKADQGDLGLIIVDYLQLMDGEGSDRVQALSKITRSLKLLAKELDVVVIALSQLSRGVESRTNKRPMMSDLRESGALEQDADLVMMLYREEYYDPNTPDRGVAEVIITKHRNGPTGTVKLLFQPEYTKFLNRSSIGQ